MCKLCLKVKELKAGRDASLIKEFKHSFFVVFDHQFFPGYSMVVAKDHVTDFSNLEREVAAEFMTEVWDSAQAVKKSFNPYRVNYASLGNVVNHLHFHIIPRYEKELSELEVKHPWFQSENFDDYVIDDNAKKNISQTILANF